MRAEGRPGNTNKMRYTANDIALPKRLDFVRFPKTSQAQGPVGSH